MSTSTICVPKRSAWARNRAIRSGPLDAVREARVVLDVAGEHQLAAGRRAGEHDRLEVGARRVDRRGQAGRPGADDEELASRCGPVEAETKPGPPGAVATAGAAEVDREVGQGSGRRGRRDARCRRRSRSPGRRRTAGDVGVVGRRPAPASSGRHGAGCCRSCSPASTRLADSATVDRVARSAVCSLTQVYHAAYPRGVSPSDDGAAHASRSCGEERSSRAAPACPSARRRGR